MLVGGTGFYLRTLLDGIAPIPEIDPDVRRLVSRALPTAFRVSGTHESKIDAASATVLSPNDDSRIKRALEVMRSTGKSIVEWRDATRGWNR
jgi:tRNA dimethylallyltransferase